MMLLVKKSPRSLLGKSASGLELCASIIKCLIKLHNFSQVQFVKCDVRSWEDQVSVFEAAVHGSPHKSCDIVIANAGIIGKDDLYELQGIALTSLE
jgi:NAD(P)-dependent dehydrogenase (short-subunit alcohol dehydrogenase family)